MSVDVSFLYIVKLNLLCSRLVWENGYTQVVDSPTRGDALLDVYLVRPESLITSCSTVQVISDHCGVLLEVEWEENCCEPQVERLFPVYHKTNVVGLQILPSSGINSQYRQAMGDVSRRYEIISRT
jgi:hypothetical protein